ncbi:MAG TPA: type VI secretion system-associated protein TagF, partial [Polyangia bacterium]
MAWRSLLSGRNRTNQTMTAGATTATGAEVGPAGGGDAGVPSAPAVFGKVADRRDFVRLGAGTDAAFERWLEEGLEFVAGKGGGFPAGPVRLLASGADPGSAWSGVLVPGADAVGRVFPLALFRHVAAAGGGGLFDRWAEQARFFSRAQTLLARTPTVDALTAALAAWQPESPNDDRNEGVGLGAPPAGAFVAADDSADAAALAAELDNVAARAALALADLERTQPPSAPSPRLDEDTAPLPVLSDVVTAPASARTLSEPRPRELTPPFLTPPSLPASPLPPDDRGALATHESPLRLLETTPALAAFERAFGPHNTGAVEHALHTFLAACEAARGPARKSITVEAPAPEPALAAFWIALAGRKLAGMAAGPSLLAEGDRLVFE